MPLLVAHSPSVAVAVVVVAVVAHQARKFVDFAGIVVIDVFVGVVSARVAATTPPLF